MSREIKFRAWDKQEKEYVYNDIDFCVRCLELESKGSIENPDSTQIGFSAEFEGQRFDMEQFTGLHDKNGVEIYEGDIIRYNSDDLGESIGIVEYTVWRYGSEFTKKWIKGGCGLKWNQYEVTGNIHKNPELLEKRGGE